MPLAPRASCRVESDDSFSSTLARSFSGRCGGGGGGHGRGPEFEEIALARNLIEDELGAAPLGGCREELAYAVK